MLSDAEVIASFMDGPKPDIRCEEVEWPFVGRNANGRRYTWWRWERNCYGHLTIDISLNECHAVEARLTDEQWWAYERELRSVPFDGLMNTAARVFVHATAEQKIKALASVLRKEEPQ